MEKQINAMHGTVLKYMYSRTFKKRKEKTNWTCPMLSCSIVCLSVKSVCAHGLANIPVFQTADCGKNHCQDSLRLL